MFNFIKSHICHWVFIGLFTATPFFIPAVNAEVIPNNGEEIAGIGIGVRYGGDRYYNRHYRQRYYPRQRYYYRHNDPYYRDSYGPYYQDRYYNRYPRRGGGIYFHVR